MHFANASCGWWGKNMVWGFFGLQLGVWRTIEHKGLFKSHLHYVTLFMYWHQATTHYSTKAMLYNINMLENVSSTFSLMLWQIYCAKVKIKQLICWLSEREWWDEKALTGLSVQHQSWEHPLDFPMAVDSLLFQTSNCKQPFYSIYRLRMTPWHLPYKESKNCSCVFLYEHLLIKYILKNATCCFDVDLSWAPCLVKMSNDGHLQDHICWR